MFLFVVPVLLYIAIPVVILHRYKENFYDIDKVILSGKKYLIGYAYHEKNYGYLKWKTVTSQDRKEVLAIGSSRVLQFRAQMFSKPFYNSGYTVNGIDQFAPYLKSIPKEKYPAYLIIGFDQWMFNRNTDSLVTEKDSGMWKNSFTFSPENHVIKNSWRDLIQGTYDFFEESDESNSIRIGLFAHFRDKGFRNDGSMDYGDFKMLLANDPEYGDHNYKNTFERIETGTSLFQYGDSVNPDAIRELDELLQFCKANNIEVIAFLPPFANRVYEKMLQSGKYNYLNDLYPAIAPLFRSYNFELYDFSTMQKCGSTDEETIDGFHGSEHTYIKILIKMLESGSKLNEVADIKKLVSDREKRINRYNVYD